MPFYCGERCPGICFVLGLKKSSTYSGEYASGFSRPAVAHLPDPSSPRDASFLSGFIRTFHVLRVTFHERSDLTDFLPAWLWSILRTVLAHQIFRSILGRGRGMARVMKMSARQLGEKYLATGVAGPSGLECYCWFANDLNSWAIYYATIAVSGQKA